MRIVSEYQVEPLLKNLSSSLNRNTLFSYTPQLDKPCASILFSAH